MEEVFEDAGNFAVGEEIPYDWIRHDWPPDDEVGEVDYGDSLSLGETFSLCMVPTTRDAVLHIGNLYFWCFLHSTLIRSVGGNWCLGHISSIITGCLVLHHFFGHLLLTFVLHALLIGGVLSVSGRFSPGNASTLVISACLAFILPCELYFVDPVHWHSVRGAQMIMMMKAVSTAIDLNSDAAAAASDSHTAPTGLSPARSTPVSRKPAQATGPACKNSDTGTTDGIPPIAGSKPFTGLFNDCLKVWGYLFHPGTCVFGPWIAFTDYLNQKPGSMIPPLYLFSYCSFLSFFWLAVSVCWSEFLIPNHFARYSIWLIAFRQAWSFRASHYFVSFCSQASMVISGVHQATWMTAGKRDVCRPWLVERSRSLLEVVVNWNIPMHFWLKKYVFAPVRSASSSAPFALFVTYSASALLHGVNFQLCAVLLSLGVAAFAQHECRRCYADTRLWRPLLFASTVLQLVYLGVTFDGSASGEFGYSWRHTLTRWRELSFAGHLLTAGMLVLGAGFARRL